MISRTILAAIVAGGIASAQQAYNTTSAAPCSITTSVITESTQATTTTSTSVDPVTETVTRPSYTSTTSTSGSFPQTQSVFVTSGATTYTIATATATESTCTSTQLTSVVNTPTFYDGLYTPSPLRTSCSAVTTYSATYPQGTTTVTKALDPFTIYDAVYSPSVSTEYLYSTTTVTQTVPSIAYVSGTTTSTESYRCRATTTTATASATVTQAAACIPKNLIENGGVATPYADSAAFTFNALAPESQDASACCETCLETAHCAGMSFRVSYDGFNQCTIFNGTTPACDGKAFGVNPGKGSFAQAGCGYIVQAVY